jgi:hypothetical protein
MDKRLFRILSNSNNILSILLYLYPWPKIKVAKVIYSSVIVKYF